MKGVVVDACVMQHFLTALISKTENDATRLVDCLSSGEGFAIDEKDKVVNQWRETCRHQVMEDWITLGIQAGYIRMVSSGPTAQHKKHLQTKLGFPYEQRHEGVYVEVAHTAPPHILVTDDIDFWEPKAKRRSAAEKARFVSGRTGGVCTYLRKKMKTQVLSVQQALSDLGCTT